MLNRIFAIIIGFSISQCAFALQATQCGFNYDSDKPVQIIFVNGIDNLINEACASSDQVISLIGIQSNYSFSYFYNPKDPSGDDQKELSWQSHLSNEALAAFKYSPDDVYGDPSKKANYYSYIGVLYKQYIANNTSAPGTVVQTTNRLYQKIKAELATTTKKVLIVAHSQGNFYTEAAYAMLLHDAQTKGDDAVSDLVARIRVVGVASVAASTPNNKYLSHSKDAAVFLGQEALSRLSQSNYKPLPPNEDACILSPCNDRDATNVASLYYVARLPDGSNDTALHNFLALYLNTSIYSLNSGLAFPTIIRNLTAQSLLELASSNANIANGHRYELITCGTWSQCRDAALAKGGNLVTIRNQAESDWLQSTFGTSEDLWIGMYFDRYVRELKWASGEPVTFERWGANKNGASVNGYPEEYCVYMNATSGGQPGYWNDVECGSIYRKKAIVEYLSNGYQGKTSWDLAGDFTTRINPSGVWGFGYRNNALATIQPLSASKGNCSDIGLTCWVMSAPAPDIPLIGANLNDSTLVKRTIVVAPNEVVLHPGQNGEQAVVTWKAPAAGTYRIKGAFQVVDNAPSGVNVAIDEGLASIYSVSLGGANRSGTFDFNRQFMKDEAIYFSVDAAGNYGNDSTALSVTVTKVAGSGAITVLANTIPGATVTVPSGASACSFVSTGTWSAGPQAPPQYQNADGVIGGTSYNLTNFGVPMPGEGNMALVVKHSSTGNWDLLGSSRTISVVAGETLSFMMNDATTFGYTDGNTGQLSTVWSCN